MTGASRGALRCRSRRVLVTAVGALFLGCGPAVDGVVATSDMLTLHSSGSRGSRTLRLDAAPGARINARLPPALELRDGERVSFTSDSLTADSSYFASSPTATLTPPRRANGTLRASVCPAAMQVCLSVTLDVALR